MVIGKVKMAKTGSPEFCRDEAIRLTKIAADTEDPGLRLGLFEIAVRFLRLAECEATNSDLALTGDVASASASLSLASRSRPS